MARVVWQKNGNCLPGQAFVFFLNVCLAKWKIVPNINKTPNIPDKITRFVFRKGEDGSNSDVTPFGAELI